MAQRNKENGADLHLNRTPEQEQQPLLQDVTSRVSAGDRGDFGVIIQGPGCSESTCTENESESDSESPAGRPRQHDGGTPAGPPPTLRRTGDTGQTLRANDEGQGVQGSIPSVKSLNKGQDASLEALSAQRTVSFRDRVRQFVSWRRHHQARQTGSGPSEAATSVSSTESDCSSPRVGAGAPQDTTTTANIPQPDNHESAERAAESSQVCCPSCNRQFTTQRGLAQHLRRDAGNECAVLRREIINEQNIPTPSARRPSKRRQRAPMTTRESGSEASAGPLPRPSKGKRARKQREEAEDPAAPSPAQTAVPLAIEEEETAPATSAEVLLSRPEHRESPQETDPPEGAHGSPKGPIIRRKPIRIPRLTAAACAGLCATLETIALSTKTAVESGTWKEVEAAADSFTTHIYDAIWFSNKVPGESEQAAGRNRRPENVLQQENQVARVTPRFARAQDNVTKALLALREEERVQQEKPQASSLEAKMKKRALERNLRAARRHLVAVLKEESAQALQTLYNKNRRRCMEHLLADSGQAQSQECPLQLSELERHFKEQQSVQSIDIKSQDAQEFLQALAAAPRGASAIDSCFTEEDVRAQLLKSNLESAAGPDGIGFLVYKRFEDLLIPAITALFNACAKYRRVPAKWKESVTVLIPKGGDPRNVKNWRPINLQDCIYKLYAALWAKKITDWAIQSGVASKSQKGFMPVNGCHEHLFIAQSILNSTRRRKKPLYMTYYDLKDAFGSIPHELIHVVLKAQRLPQQVLEIVNDLYKGASFCVMTKEGCTGRITTCKGVKQGCPLSPILFNLAIEPLLHRLAACEEGLELRTTDGKPPARVTHMAYADDLKTVASTRTGIQALHGVVERFLRWTGLEANPSKCATLGLKVGKTKQVPEPVELKLHNQVLPVVKLGEAYKYLGIKDALESSVHHSQILSVMSKARKDITKILRSELLPWQKLDAIRTFVMSRLDYHLRHCYPYKHQLSAFDLHVRATLKAVFNLSKSTVQELFHQPIANGGLGCTSLHTIAAATQLGHAIQMLNSPDSMVREVAEGQLMEVITKIYVYTPDKGDNDRETILAFLNNQDVGCLKRKSKKTGDVRSLWSELPGNIAWCKTKVVAGEGGRYLVQRADGSSLDQTHLIRSIKQHIAERQRDAWKDKADQGKSVAYQKADSNSFLRGPTRLKTKEVLFAVRARSAQIPTRAYLKKIGASKVSRCRHCTADPETLAHVLNHCPHHMDSKIKARHDKALERITTAIKSSSANRGKTLQVDAAPEDMETQLRPDILLKDEKRKTVAIADLAIAFEDHKKNSFGEARLRKEEKYAGIKRHYEARGYRVTVQALVYGSLGCIAQENMQVLTRNLGINARTAYAVQRDISLDCIRYSHQIWGFHAADNGSRHATGAQRSRGGRRPTAPL